MYVDVTCLLTHKVSNLQSKLEHLERLARNVGLEINIKETKERRINNTSTENIMLHQVKYVDSFC